MMAILIFLTLSSADTLQNHKQQMQVLGQKMMEYEIRLDELKNKKEKTPDGEALEEILSEIADIHKELLTMKKNREGVLAHIHKEHPQEESYSDLSFYKQTKLKDKKSEKPDVQLDKKLDDLLRLVQSQYSRTLSEDFKVSESIQTEEDVRKKLREQRTQINRANKKKYLREEVGNTLKPE